MKKKTAHHLLIACTAAWLGIDIAAAQHSLRESTDHYLLLHSGRISSSENVELVLGTPEKHEGNPIMVEDKPWEVRYGNLYPNVIFDPFEKFYKGWFGPFIVDESTTQTPPDKRGNLKYRGTHAGSKRESGVLYGTSHNGELWNKPLLDLNPWADGAKTNILLRGPHGAGVFRDPRDPKRLYKLFAKGDEGLELRTSADGIRWSEAARATGATAAGNTHNFAFWASERREYVAMTQLWEGEGEDRISVIGRTSSKDFRKWKPVEPVLKGLTPDRQVIALPVLDFGGVYLGFPAIHDLKEDRVHTELAWSPNTIRWERIAPGTPFLKNGEAGSHDWGSVFTGSVIAMNDGVRLFYGGSDDTLSGWRKGSLNLARLETDRFAGYRAENNKTGFIQLKPLPYRSGTIRVTADIGRNGYVMVSAEDNDGNNIVPSTKIEKTGIDIVIDADIPRGTRELALRLRLQNATVFSVGFK